jgi:hypothetical protein
MDEFYKCHFESPIHGDQKSVSNKVTDFSFEDSFEMTFITLLANNS